MEFEGVFYIDKKGAVKGVATFTKSYWHIKDGFGNLIIRKKRIYLDKAKKILAPRYEKEKESASFYVRILMDKYRKNLESFQNKAYEEVSPSYAMGISLARSLYLEYRYIYYNVFANNAVKFIMDV